MDMITYVVERLLCRCHRLGPLERVLEEVPELRVELWQRARDGRVRDEAEHFACACVVPHERVAERAVDVARADLCERLGGLLVDLVVQVLEEVGVDRGAVQDGGNVADITRIESPFDAESETQILQSSMR